MSSKLDLLLKEYGTLPEYSELATPDIHTKSLFGDYPINIAATRGIVDEVSELIARGADPNAKGEHGYTPLHNAVEQGHLIIVEYIINSGADQELKNDDGETPAELAKTMGLIDIYNLLKK